MDLEPIPKLEMDRNEFAPDNNSAGKMNQGEVIGGFFLKPDKQFAEAVEKRVCNLNNPAASMEIRIALYFQLFLATGPNMGYITTFQNLFATACVASVQA